MDRLLSLIVRIVFLLDPVSKTGEVYETKDGSKLVARAYVELDGGIVISGFGIWAHKGSITVSSPTDGFRQPVISAGKLSRQFDEDNNVTQVRVKPTDDSREAFQKWAEPIVDAYGAVRDNPDLRGVWMK